MVVFLNIMLVKSIVLIIVWIEYYKMFIWFKVLFYVVNFELEYFFKR